MENSLRRFALIELEKWWKRGSPYSESSKDFSAWKILNHENPLHWNHRTNNHIIMYTILHDVTIKAPAAKIFEAITQPVALENWWPLRCSIDSQTPPTYNFYFTEEYDWYGTVAKSVTNQCFYIRMTQSDDDWAPTTFGFDLEELDRAVRVKFHHKGWQSTNHHFRRTSFCWAILLSGLKRYVEEGHIIPFDQRA